MKKMLSVIIVSIMLFNIGCGGGGGDSSDDSGSNIDSDKVAYLQINTDPINPLTAILTGIDSGGKLYIYGEKDENGDPINIDSLQYYEAGQTLEDQPSTFMLNEEYLPFYVTATDGRSATIVYNDGIATVHLVENDGSISISHHPFNKYDYPMFDNLHENLLAENDDSENQDMNIFAVKPNPTVVNIKVDIKLEDTMSGEDYGWLKDTTSVVAKAENFNDFRKLRTNTGYIYTISHTESPERADTSYQLSRLKNTAWFTIIGGAATIISLPFLGPATATAAGAGLISEAAAAMGANVAAGATLGALGLLGFTSVIEYVEETRSGRQKLSVTITDKLLDINEIVEIEYDIDDFDIGSTPTIDLKKTITIRVGLGFRHVAIIPNNPPGECQKYKLYYHFRPKGSVVYYQILGSDRYDQEMGPIENPDGKDILTSPYHFAPHDVHSDIITSFLRYEGERVGPINKIKFSPYPDTSTPPAEGNPRDGCESSGNTTVKSLAMYVNDINTSYETNINGNNQIIPTKHSASFYYVGKPTVSMPMSNKIAQTYDSIGTDGHAYQGFTNVVGEDEEFNHLINYEASTNILFKNGGGSTNTFKGSKKMEFTVDDPYYKEFYVSGNETCDYIDSITYSYATNVWYDKLVGQIQCDKDSSLTIFIHYEN